ncbi:MAG: hypothetical protein ABI863_05825 [Ginsengibacter sp.]
MIEYDILNAENFVSTEHFDLLEDGLKREHVNFFKPLAALEERFNLIDINRETINIEDIPQKILKIQPDKIKEIFQGHLAKSLEILKNHSCRKLEMVFGVVSIDELYKIAYTYGGKSFEVTFFKSEDCFYAPENPWEDFRKNVACEIEQHHKKGNKMATLQKINLYKKMNISTVRTEVIKEEILQSYAKRDVLILILPYLLSGIVLGLMFKVDKDGLVVVFILNIIPFAWIIYKRHKRRRDKIPPMRLYPRKIK